MAAVAVAKFDFLESPIQQKERLRTDVKLVHRLPSKNEERKGAIKSYLKSIEAARNHTSKGLPPPTKKKVPAVKGQKKARRQNKQVKQRPSSGEDYKKEALETCLNTVKAAKTQLQEELLLQLKKQYHLELESYEAQSLEFLKIQDSQVLSIWFLVEHFKKFFVVAEQMMKENVIHSEYHGSLENTRNQILQLVGTLESTAMLLTGKISPKNGYPTLPDELKTASSRSLRQNRDYLFVKEYKNILEVIEEFLKNF